MTTPHLQSIGTFSCGSPIVDAAPRCRDSCAAPATGTTGASDAAQTKPAAGYAGDVSPQLAYQWWQAGEAVLVDVRTDAEREWVGFVPGALALAWKIWPGMALNPDFDSGIMAGVPAGRKALLLCRSGVRSVAAARRAAELGIAAYNILEGFEGDADQDAHRGTQSGWRYQGLPWQQG